MEGWIKLHRKFLSWEWYNKSEMVHLFLHLILSANHEEKNWQGVTIKRGQLITGLNSLNQQTNISYQKLRTCLSKLKKTGELTIKSTNKYSIITICNYDSYQLSENTTNKQTNKQLTINQQSTNNKQELKELKKNISPKNFYKDSKEKATNERYIKFIDYIFGNNDLGEELTGIYEFKKGLTEQQFINLYSYCNKNNIKLHEKILALENNPKYRKGKTSLYLTLLNWVKRDAENRK